MRLPLSPVTVALCACLFLTGLAAAAVMPYRAIVGVETLGLTNTQFALITGFGGLATALTSLVLGVISDRTEDRRALVLLVVAVGCVGYGMVWLYPHLWTFALAFAVIIPFGNTLTSQSFSYARSYYNREMPERAAFMMSMLRSLFSLAWVIVPPLAGWIAMRGSAIDTFQIAILALLGFAGVFASLYLLPGTRIAPVRAAQMGKLSIAPSRRWGMAGVTLIRCGIISHQMVLPLTLRTDYGGSLADIGFNASLAAALEVPLMVMWAYAARRWSNETLLAVNGVLFAAYLGLVPVAGSVHGVLLLQGLNALATSAQLSLTIAYMQEAIAGRVGTSTSLMDTVTVLATLLASGIFAVMSGPSGYRAIFPVIAGLSLLGAGLIWTKGRGGRALA